MDAARETFPTVVVPLDGDVPAADSGLGQSERRADLEVRFRTLDERERKIVLLRFFADYDAGGDRTVPRRLAGARSRILRGALDTMRWTVGGEDQ